MDRFIFRAVRVGVVFLSGNVSLGVGWLCWLFVVLPVLGVSYTAVVYYLLVLDGPFFLLGCVPCASRPRVAAVDWIELRWVWVGLFWVGGCISCGRQCVRRVVESTRWHLEQPCFISAPVVGTSSAFLFPPSLREERVRVPVCVLLWISVASKLFGFTASCLLLLCELHDAEGREVQLPQVLFSVAVCVAL